MRDELAPDSTCRSVGNEAVPRASLVRSVAREPANLAQLLPLEHGGR
jgi:hypothetical protein